MTYVYIFYVIYKNGSDKHRCLISSIRKKPPVTRTVRAEGCRKNPSSTFKKGYYTRQNEVQIKTQLLYFWLKALVPNKNLKSTNYKYIKIRHGEGKAGEK